jgi:hypothetical protein
MGCFYDRMPTNLDRDDDTVIPKSDIPTPGVLINRNALLSDGLDYLANDFISHPDENIEASSSTLSDNNELLALLSGTFSSNVCVDNADESLIVNASMPNAETDSTETGNESETTTACYQLLDLVENDSDFRGLASLNSQT